MPKLATASARGTTTHAYRARLGEARAALARVTGAEADPHVAHRDKLVSAHAAYVAAFPGMAEEIDAAPYRAHISAERRLLAIVRKVIALPPPRTRDGLAVLGLALALSAEGLAQDRRADNAAPLVAAARGIVAALGLTLPAGFVGFGDEPDFAEREAARLEGVRCP